MLKKLFVIICMIGVCLAQRVYGDEDMQLNAKSAVLIDAENGRILYGKNERKAAYGKYNQDNDMYYCH